MLQKKFTKNQSGYSSGVTSEHNGLGITVGQIEAPQQPNLNFNGTIDQSQSSSIRTNGGVATGDEDSQQNYITTQTGSGQDFANLHSHQLLEEQLIQL